MNHLYWSVPAATAGAIGVTLWSMLAPRCRWWGEVIASGPVEDPPRVALTFDDGPTAGATERVLDLLGELAVPAAFFVIGANVRRWPALVRRMHDEGHLVANHSYDHSHFGFFRGPRYWERQIAETDASIERIIGRRPAMFRPPMGMKTRFITGAAAGAEQAVITWTRRGMDGVTTTPDRILQRLGPTTQAGDIVMLHDGIEPNGRRDAAVTAAVLKPLVLSMRARGLTLVRLDELINRPAYVPVSALGHSIMEPSR